VSHTAVAANEEPKSKTEHVYDARRAASEFEIDKLVRVGTFLCKPL
jgi:hypothetical protein